MKLDKLKEILSNQTSNIVELVEQNLINDGDTCETSQRCCLTLALNQVIYNINGITKNDVKNNRIETEYEGCIL